MKVYRSLEEFQKVPKLFVTQGMFDGVHIGHQLILARVVQSAKESGGESMVITYWPHPRAILYPESEQLRPLTTLEEKIHLIEKCGIDHVLIIPFTKEFSEMSSTDFIRDVLVGTLAITKFVIGYDHTFGRNREGNYQQLKTESIKYGFDVEEFEKKSIGDVAPSSGLIRKLLAQGDIANAEKYLGRPTSVIS